MLFNSQVFLLLFLPVTLIAYYLLSQGRARREWLLISASLFFYGFWDYRLLPLLICSIVANWFFAKSIRGGERKVVFVAGVALNLFIIGIFKYADFFAGSLAWLFGEQHTPWNIVLPLGISFFTFQQISYLADRFGGEAPEYRFREYFLYVSFFPQLIAGPIVRHNELINQFEASPGRPGMYERLSRGVTLFAIGLAKKVLIADTAARIADPLFALAADTKLTLIDAWMAALAFTIQIYFDFSGYSDMAIGLALMFGLRLPFNFNIPYRATTIQEFWRRWHMTLSRFLRDYLYIPLGGGRYGLKWQSLALTVTMFLGGLWHGAGWTFVVWGLMHGVGLAAHAWWVKLSTYRLPMPASWVVTMVFVILGWVLFRANSFPEAISITQSMFGLNGLSWETANYVGPKYVFGWTGLIWETANYEGPTFVILIGALISIVGPSSQDVALKRKYGRPWAAFATASMLVLCTVIVGSGKHPEFIYFQF